jgi:SAM-dependent methyltransferase/uncharacterized protein YbaR (Trm112 family)
MRRALLGLLICPHCGEAPLTADGEGERIQGGSLVCPHGHRLPIRRGVVDALPALTPTILEQRAVGARERLGQLSSEEAESYRRHISQIGAATYNELIRDNARAALETLPIQRGRSLDLGGGSGWLAAELSARGFSAVSLDIEDPFERAAQIERGAQARTYELVTDVLSDGGADAVDFIVGDFGHLPFADATFDLVTTSAALHHSEDPVRTLRQASRVLKAGGYMLSVNEQTRGIFRDESPVMAGHDEGAGERIYWAGEYLGFFRQAGLRPQLSFPGWIDRKLRDQDWKGVVYYPRLRPITGWLWRVPGIRPLVRGPLLRPALDIFGLTTIITARKPA